MQTSSSRTGIILVNLGTPEAPSASAIRSYLGEFLWDKRVVEIPRPLWWLILNFIILPWRPRKIVHSYQSIWLKEGSPLRVISLEQAKRLQASIDQQFGENTYQVEFAMTYGQPSLDQVWGKLQKQGIDKVFVLPLYPQYSATTTGAMFNRLSRTFQAERNIPELRICKDYHAHPLFIKALCTSVEKHWKWAEKNGDTASTRFLLFSFHGIPSACIEKGDPYYEHCKLTARNVAQQLGLEDHQWQISFQSRVGRAKWLEPYTDETVRKLGKQGLKRLDVICPGFSADCLETLEEISIQNREFYEKAGGSGFAYIPALNNNPEHIALMNGLFQEKCSDWLNQQG